VAWLALFGAIALEVSSTLCLKTSDGFSRFWPSVFVILGYTGSFACLGYTLKSFDVGLVYAIWSAVGTAAIVIIGATAFQEPVTVPRMGGVILIVIGVVVLNLSESKGAESKPAADSLDSRRPSAPRHLNTSGLSTNGPRGLEASGLGSLGLHDLRPLALTRPADRPWIPRQRSPYIEALPVDQSPEVDQPIR
jgi:small multidrug resistance pump